VTGKNDIRGEYRGPAVVAVAFFIVAVTVGFLVPVVHGEGLLTWHFVQVFQREFLAGLFFQKLHPACSLLFLPVAPFGWSFFLVAHIAAASLAVYMLGRSVQMLGGSGFVGSIVIAASPVFLIATVTGQSNVEGIVFMAVSLYLITRGRLLSAGIVLGAASWVRYEFSIFVIGLAVLALLDRNYRRLIPGLLVFPALYLIAGAVYHSDLLWWIHYPPTLAHAIEGTQFRLHDKPGHLNRMLIMALTVTPVWALAISMRSGRMGRLEKGLLAILALTAVVMMAIPFLDVLNFNHNPRYWLVFLPFLAVAVGRLARDTKTDLSGMFAWIVAAAAVPLAFHLYEREHFLFAVGPLTIPLIIWLVSRYIGNVPARMAVVLVVLGSTAGAISVPSLVTEFQMPLPGAGLDQAVKWLSTNPRGTEPKEVHTNIHELNHLLGRNASGSPRPVRYMVQNDIAFEIYGLTNHEAGQLDRLTGALGDTLYGGAVWPCETYGTVDHADRVYVLRDDYRFDSVYPAGYMEEISYEVARFDDVAIRLGRARPVLSGRHGMPSGAHLRIGCGPNQY